MKLSGVIPPNSAAAQGLHRAMIGVQAGRVARRSHPRAPALARALARVARDRMPVDERRWFELIEARRTEIPFEMVAAGTQFALGPPADGADGGGAAAATRATAPAADLAQAWHVARWASIPPVWGRLMTALVRELAPGSCLELGTGLGLSGAYQGAALELNGAGKLLTLDVHEAGKIAQRGFAELGLAERVELVPGLIDETLPSALAGRDPLDFAFLDAEHTEAATIRHFAATLPHLADGAVVVFDDIHQTEEMRRAWHRVIGEPRVSLALPLRRIGIVALSGAQDPAT